MTNAIPDTIYHLCPLSGLLAGMDPQHYTPQAYPREGFVHATTEPQVVLAVAGDYFANCSEALLVLAISTARLSAEVRLEDPAPLAGGRAHLAMARQFPHIYGPVDRIAIDGVGILEPQGDAYTWPQTLMGLEDFLHQHATDSD